MRELIHGHEALIGTLLGISLLFPFTFFIFDVSKNPDKYRE